MKINKLILYIQLKIANPYKRAELYKKHGVEMGANCQVFPDVTFGSEPYLVKLGSNVKITNSCTFITHDGGIEVLRNLNIYKNGDVFGEIIIGNNVFLGNRTIVLPNVKIGDNVIIGAGSVVTKDIASNSVAAGVPAKVIKTLPEYEQNILNRVELTKGLNRLEKKEYLIKKYK